jgi:hypothetical protein
VSSRSNALKIGNLLSAVQTVCLPSLSGQIFTNWEQRIRNVYKQHNSQTIASIRIVILAGFYTCSHNCEKRLLASSRLTVSLSVCPSAWNKSPRIGRFFIKFYITKMDLRHDKLRRRQWTII